MIRIFLIEEAEIQSTIELLITDENMEYMNGSEGIRYIRNIVKRKKLKRMKIYSLNSNEDVDIMQSIIKAGADKLLPNPMTRRSIESLLKENLSLR